MINLADLGNSPYIASDDYAVGTILPVVIIERIDMQEVPTAGKSKRDPKAVAWFVGARKGYLLHTFKLFNPALRLFGFGCLCFKAVDIFL